MCVKLHTACVVLCALGFFGTGCIDPDRLDRALTEVDVSRREAAARESQLRAMEERQAALAQQMSVLLTVAQSSLSRDDRKDAERDAKLADLSSRLAHLQGLLVKMREEEQMPMDVDIAAARRLEEQSSAEERAATVRKAQALLDAGLAKLTVRSGKLNLSIVRPLDVSDPYATRESSAPKTGNAPATKAADKRRDLLDWR